MRYFKLVRDRIPEIIRKNGGTPTFNFADDVFFERALKEKLREEVEEFCREENTEEMADILEVIDACIAYFGLSKAVIARCKKKKARANGRFKKRIILEEA